MAEAGLAVAEAGLAGTEAGLAGAEVGLEGGVTTGTNATSNLWAVVLPRVLSLATAFLSDDRGDATALTREAVDLASKLFSVDSSSVSFSGWGDILLGGGMWSLYVFSVPVILSFVVWYFITTFILRKNILGRSLGAQVGLREEEEALDDLTARVAEAAEHPR